MVFFSAYSDAELNPQQTICQEAFHYESILRLTKQSLCSNPKARKKKKSLQSGMNSQHLWQPAIHTECTSQFVCKKHTKQAFLENLEYLFVFAASNVLFRSECCFLAKILSFLIAV